jgi:hypothetical protein
MQYNAHIWSIYCDMTNNHMKRNDSNLKFEFQSFLLIRQVTKYKQNVSNIAM